MTIDTATVLRPGDKVLLTVSDEPDDEACVTVMSELRKAFPGVEFFLVCGVSGVVVQTPDQEGTQDDDQLDG